MRTSPMGWARPPRQGQEQLVSPLEQIRAAAETPPSKDEPVAHESPVPSDRESYYASGVAQAATEGREGTLVKGFREIGAAHAQERPGSAYGAAKAVRKAVKSHINHIRRQDRVTSLLNQRLHRVRWSREMGMLLIVILATGEVALNSSALIANGDVVWMAIVAMFGVGVGTIAVAMLGGPLRRCVDRLRAGEPTKKARKLHLDGYFRRPGDLFELTGYLLVLALVVGGLAVAIAMLRLQSGDTPVYGVFTAIIALGAVVVDYVGEDAVADLLEGLRREGDHLAAARSREEQTLNECHSAQANTQGVFRSTQHEAAATHSMLLAEGEFAMAGKLSAAFGSYPKARADIEGQPSATPNPAATASHGSAGGGHAAGSLQPAATAVEQGLPLTAHARDDRLPGGSPADGSTTGKAPVPPPAAGSGGPFTIDSRVPASTNNHS